MWNWVVTRGNWRQTGFSAVPMVFLSRSNFSVHWGTGRTSLRPPIGLLSWGIPWECWYPWIQNLCVTWKGFEPMHPVKRALTEKANWDAAPKSSTLPTRPRTTAARHGCCGGVNTLGYTYPHVRPLLHSTGGYPSPVDAKSRVRSVAHWAEKLDRVVFLQWSNLLSVCHPLIHSSRLTPAFRIPSAIHLIERLYNPSGHMTPERLLLPTPRQETTASHPVKCLAKSSAENISAVTTWKETRFVKWPIVIFWPCLIRLLWWLISGNIIFFSWQRISNFSLV